MVTTLLYSVAGGMLTVLSAGCPRQLSWRYLRLVAVIVFALSLGDTLWTVRSMNVDLLGPMAWPIWAGSLTAVCAVLLLFAAPVATKAPALYRAVALLGGACGIAASYGLVLRAIPAGVGRMTIPMIIVGQVISALLLGSITVSWLLGHAYLTATKMTIAPLRRFTRLLAFSALARAAFLVASLVLGWILLGASASAETGAGAGLPDLMYRSWLIVFLRVGLGIVAVVVFAFMVADCVRLRSTQSATGILYFGSIFAYVGELAGQYLLFEWGWPI